MISNQLITRLRAGYSHISKRMPSVSSTLSFALITFMTMPTIALAVEDSDAIKGSDPGWDIGKMTCKLVFNLCRSGTEFFIGFGGDLMKTLSLDSLLSGNFRTGAFSKFFLAAAGVNKYALAPIASVILAAAFVMTMLKISDDSQRLGSKFWKNGFLQTVIMYAVSWWVIRNSVDIAGGIYWVMQRANAFVKTALSSAGVSVSSGLDLGAKLSETYMTAYDAITYGGVGQCVIYFLASLVFVAVCVSCFCYIISVALLRMADIYLRVAFAPIPSAFVVNDRSRAITWTYLKRFAAVCFQASVLLITIALAPLFFDVVGSAINLSAVSASSLGAAVASIIAPCIALGAITSFVKKSEPIANSLFGL